MERFVRGEPKTFYLETNMIALMYGGAVGIEPGQKLKWPMSWSQNYKASGTWSDAGSAWSWGWDMTIVRSASWSMSIEKAIPW